MTVRHIVTWKLAAETPEQRAADAAEAARRLGGLLGVVPAIRALSVGANVAFPESNGDLALIADFDDLAGVEAYLTHPAHVEAGAFVRGVTASRIAVDVEV